MSNANKRPAFNRDNSRSICIQEGLAFLAQTNGKSTNNIAKRKIKRVVIFEAAQHAANISGRKSALKTRSTLAAARQKIVNQRRQALNNTNVKARPASAPEPRSKPKKIRNVIPKPAVAKPLANVTNTVPVTKNNAGFLFSPNVATNPGNTLSSK